MSAVEDFRIHRVCPRCGYTIRPGWMHVEQPQPEGASHVVCSLERSPRGVAMRGPMAEVISTYLDQGTFAAALDPTTLTGRVGPAEGSPMT